MAEILKPIGDKSLAGQAYEAIRDAILKMDLAPGQALSEAGLATALSISKTPIREALQQLQQAGLIVAVPHKGYFVSELTLRDALEILQIRSRLEGLAAFESCNRLTDADLRRMELLIEEAQEAFDAGQQDICAELGHQFHQVMIDRSGNSRIVSLISILSDQFHRLRLLSDRLPGRLQTSLIEHRQILAALRSRDPDLAEDLMRDHLLAVYRELEEDTALPR
jgi:DNA-binding GntR family transcriptional regulator